MLEHNARMEPQIMNETAPVLRGFAAAAKELSRNPLGVIALFLVLTYAISGSVSIFASSFTPFERDVLFGYLVGFPVLTLAAFCWLVSRHSGKLFAPSDFRDDAGYLQAQALQAAAVVRAEKLSEPEPAQGQVQLTMASAEVKMLLAGEPTGDEIEATPKKGEAIKPEADWKRTDYEMAYLYTLRTGDPKNAEAISDAYLGTEQAGQDDNTASWKAFRLGALLRFTNESNLDNFDELKRLAESNPRIGKVQEYLASGYMYYGDFETAVAIFQQAASHTADTDERTRLLGRAAFCAAKAGNPAQAEQIIEEIKNTCPSDQQNHNLTDSIKAVTEIVGDNDTLIPVLERIVEDNPSDSDTRFLLALKYSEYGDRDLALIHYLKIPPQHRTAAAWNNLGVEFDHWKLPSKAVDAFKTAETMGETLAAANLADTLISVGFIEEARDRCVSAMKMENPHNSVSAALARLEDVPEAEEKTLAGITQKAREAVVFYKELAKAIFLPNVDAIATVWNGPQCELSVTLEDKQFTAVGSYELPANALLAFIPAAASVPPDRFTIEYHGSIKGRSITGTVSRKSLNTPPPTLLSLSTNDPVPFRMVVADSAGELSVMEGQGNNRRFYVWRVKNGV
jgi:tetratricopeptide (TPR) repeat protein